MGKKWTLKAGRLNSADEATGTSEQSSPIFRPRSDIVYTLSRRDRRAMRIGTVAETKDLLTNKGEPMNSVAIAKPLKVELEATGHNAPNVLKFEREGGKDLAIELLKRAGLSGLWKVRMTEHFKCTGRTPAVQVRRPAGHGVVVWFKPGSNDTGMKAEVVVTRDCGFSPEALYKKLRGVSDAQEQTPQPPSEARDYALIKLVNRANAAVWGVRDAFVGDIHGQLVKRPPEGLKVNVIDDTHEILEEMADRGLLYEDGFVFRVARLGQELQFRMEPPMLEVPELKPAKPANPQPPAPVQPLDPLEAIKAYQVQLARLANLPEEVEKIRRRRIEIGAEVTKLTAEDDALAVDERRLLSVDIEALALLLGPPTEKK